MFSWFRKYIRKISVFGVEVEFHPPTEIIPQRPLPPATDPAPPPVTLMPPPPVTAPKAERASSESSRRAAIDDDKDAFLGQVAKKTNGEAARVTNYEQVLEDMIAWSEAQGGLLTFSPKPAKNSQATVMYRFRGRDFWDAYPNPKRPTKFCYEYNFERAYMLAEFAKLSADGRPASETVPTIWFRDLVSESARHRLKQLLGEMLGLLDSLQGIIQEDGPA